MENKEKEASKIEFIIEHLTDSQEETLRNIHAENYSGTDDDMVDDFEKWLMDLSYDELLDYLSLE